MNSNIERAILDGAFEETELGLFFPRERLMVAGLFSYNKKGEPEEYSENLVVTEGLNYIVGAAVKGTSPIINWYIAPFSGDVTVQATWTGVNFTTNATEVTAYTSLTRPAWTGGTVAAGAVNSFSAKAQFEATSDAVVIRGAGMISLSTKSGNTGTLLGASRFPSAKTLDTGEILEIGYGLQISPVV